MSLLDSQPNQPPPNGNGAVRPGPVPPPDQSRPASTGTGQQVPRSRTGVVWVSTCAAAVLAVALIVFMLQNTHTVVVHFLGMTGSTSLALMLLIAAVGGVLLTLILGSARIIQLRRIARRRSRQARP